MAQRVTIRHGEALNTGYQASVTDSDGWTYNIPLDTITWYTDDMSHEVQGGSPSCMPTGKQEEITFGTVSFRQNGGMNKIAVYVEC